MPSLPRAVASAWRDHRAVAALAVVAALIALWARHRLFPAYSWNRDEPVYLWHVDALRAGRLAPTDGGHPSLFQPWLSARGEGVLFTQYTLGWPLVLLAATVLTGSAGNALLLGAALAVIGTYAIGLELLDDRRIALVGAGLMVASPILPIQGGAHLSYLVTLGLGLLAGTLLLSGIRLERPLRVIGAGVLLGWIFLTRPYDALLWGAAFAGYALVHHRARWTSLVRPIGACMAAALPLVVAILAYNRHVTGGWLQFPITAADPMDTFGFGPKRLMPTFEIVDYDLGKAVKATAKNAFLLPWFLVGSYLGVLVAGIGLWQRRREPSTLALILISVVFPIGYFVFWGTHLSSMASRISGPIYFVPLYAPICLLIASVLVRWWSARRPVALGLVVALVIVTVPVALSRFDVNRDISVQQEAWRESVAGIDGDALVFVADTAPYLLYLNPFSSNSPNLDERVLYAADSGPEMLDLIAEMPQRRAFLQQGTIASQDIGPREDPAPLAVHLSPIEVRRGPSLTLTVNVAGGAASRRVELVTDGIATPTAMPIADGTAGITLVRAGAGGGFALGERGTVSVRLIDGVAQQRLDLVYRVVDGTIEMMLPAATYRYATLDDGTQDWRRTVTLDDLRVDLAPNSR